jgi:phage tail-like protein
MQPINPPVADLLGVGNFRVHIADQEIGFCQVGPLASKSPVDGCPEDHAPVLGNWEPVVLRRAIADKALFSWRQQALTDRGDRREVLVEQLDASGKRVANAWLLVDAWPRRWSGPTFNALETAVACEELELVYSELRWTFPPDRAGSQQPHAED